MYADHDRSYGREVSHTKIGGVPSAVISLRALIDLMITDAIRTRRSGGRPKLVFDINGQAISMFETDKKYRDDLERADIIHADGQVVVGASKIFSRTPIPDRSSTTDLFIDSFALASEAGVSYYLLGGVSHVTRACAEKIADTFPNLISGYRDGYFTLEEEAELISEINSSEVDVLWVGLGKPKEQDFCVRNRDKLRVGWIITCGGLFNYITGEYPRAPKWMQAWGLEWLHRLSTNPKHLFWRYLTTNPHAVWLIIREAMRNRYE